MAQRAAEVPELPAPRQARLIRDYSLRPSDAQLLTTDRTLGDYFEQVAQATGDPQRAARFIGSELLGVVHQRGAAGCGELVAAAALSELLRLLGDGTLSSRLAKRVLIRMVDSGQSAGTIARAEDWIQVTDETQLSRWVAASLAAHPEQVAAYRGGRTQLLRFFVGQVMAHSSGRAQPDRVVALLRAALEGDAGQSPGT